MASYFRKPIIFLIIFFFLGAAFDFSLLFEIASAESVSVSIQVISVCGDSVIEADEQCEGVALGGQDCDSLGYSGGTLACYGNCTFDTSACISVPPSAGAGGSLGWTPPLPAKLIFQGKAYPNAFLNLLKHGQVITTFEADASGFFKKELDDLIEGTYIFGLRAEDEEARKSITLNFPITIFYGMTATINGIFIPPTISLAQTQVEAGEEVVVSGQTFPESEIHLFVSSEELVKEIKANSEGNWTYNLDTALLEEGEYTVKAKAFFDEEESSFSQNLAFLVGPSLVPFPLPPLPVPPMECQGADLNLDGKINLVDFSILLFWWGQEQIDHVCVDTNLDQKVDITDFSIMMYWWTG